MAQRTFDFSTVLASSVHDMKNSLCLLIQMIEEVSEQVTDSSATEKMAKVHYEAQRINSSLMQMLTLYRENNDALPLNMDQHHLDEVIEELLLNNEIYLEQRNIAVSTEIAETATSWFDRDLIFNLLNDAIINAMRYTADKLFIKVEPDDNGGCQITVHDNGEGFPIEMLENATMPMQQLNVQQARTGLGLYFAHLIANAHERNHKKGFIELKNNGHLGGGVFSLTLP
ncbi:sensor histidine kinase [Idiomarina aminovorans]|uniref:sensor histidine kinase n=1 Tax=Idiomarina aminovorans TaxID=2914829 RepID=UPI0020031966|nr:HAMP domain-containing sensor histidine kinase [Idiomarina sp. ATCH4]MCK7459963.1 HAMP domain-containing histidine kinase [Idiomarina sp. ATCH4]